MIHDNQDFKELIKKLDSFGYNSGEGRTRIFESLMDYVVYGFCVNGGLPRWDYTREQNAVFLDMFSLWVHAAKQEIEKRGWCDIPGNIHQAYLYNKSGKGFLGQYFSPENICSLMCKLSHAGEDPGDGRMKSVYDCCCGSGRMLLAAHACACTEGRRIYCVAKDIDPICVKMTVANFIMHGVPGEVVWGDGLIPSDGRLCFLTNEHLNNPTSKLFGVPHCRIVTLQETLQGAMSPLQPTSASA